MSIKDFPKKIKPLWDNHVQPGLSRAKEHFNVKEDIFIAIAIILIGLAGFGLGKLSAREQSRGEVQIKPATFVATTTSSAINSAPLSAAAMVAGESAKGLLVASKSGTKYHFSSCPGALQIAEKNKIWFSSYTEAQKAGFSPAANCKGLQ